MRKNKIIIFCLTIVVLIGCDNVSYTYEASIDYEAPNWTSDGKVVFIKDSNYVKIAHGAMGAEQWNVEGSKEVLTLCEINSDGTGFTEKGEVLRSEDYAYALDVTGLSSSGNWVTFGIEDRHIYVSDRDGTNAEEVGQGTNPDFSPDASQIVYEKSDEGIWIMDRDGGNDHRIISDADANSPAWSSDGIRVAYIKDSLFVSDISGSLISTYGITRISTPNWGPLDTNAISLSYDTPGSGANIVIVYMSSGIIDTTDIISGNGAYWSPEGGKFIGYDGSLFIINRNGSNKWYLQP